MQPGYWYFWMDLIFIGITIGIILWAWPRLEQPTRISACWTAILVMILQVVNEYLSLFVFGAWTFSFEHNRLIGLAIAHIPVEEYLFWFAFAWMIPFLYSGLAKKCGGNELTLGTLLPPVGISAVGSLAAIPAPEKSSNAKYKGYWGWWLIGGLIFCVISFPLIWKRIHWRAMIYTIVIYVPMMFISETIALYWKWWVWNETIMWGPKVFLIPLEEFLLYFSIVPILVAMQIFIQIALEKLKKDGIK